MFGNAWLCPLLRGLAEHQSPTTPFSTWIRAESQSHNSQVLNLGMTAFAVGHYFSPYSQVVKLIQGPLFPSQDTFLQSDNSKQSPNMKKRMPCSSAQAPCSSYRPTRRFQLCPNLKTEIIISQSPSHRVSTKKKANSQVWVSSSLTYLKNCEIQACW